MPPVAPNDLPSAWPLAKRLVFRFLWLYLVVFLVQAVFSGSASHVAVWVGQLFMGSDHEFFRGPTGSGDTTISYIKAANSVTIAFVGAGIWSALAVRRLQHREVSRFAVVVARLHLGSTMLSYGGAKVLVFQFPALDLFRLTQPLGEFSPMGLAWTFMGFSPGYQRFTGGAEVVAGVLLFFARTRSLGTLLTIAVMANVFAMNMLYDIPVKLLSFHLLVTACVILSLDADRLIRLFVLNQPAPPADLSAPATYRKLLITGYVLKYLLLAGILGNMVFRLFSPTVEVDRHVLYGIHDVQSLSVDGVPQSSGAASSGYWKTLVIEKSEYLPGYPRDNFILVVYADDRRVQMHVEFDESARTLNLRPRRDEDSDVASASSAFEPPNDGAWTLRGEIGGDDVVVELMMRENPGFLLQERGFHWITEEHFNR